MKNTPYNPPDTDLENDHPDFYPESGPSSDKRLYALLFTITTCFALWFTWELLGRDRIHSECYFYALGAVNEYRLNGSFDADSKALPADGMFNKLPKELIHSKEQIEDLYRDSVVYENKSKAAYQDCLKFNQ